MTSSSKFPSNNSNNRKMKDEKVNISIPADYNGNPININLREGEAARIIELKPFGHLAVTLGTLHDYIKGRNFGSSPQENPGMLTFNVQPDNLGMKFVADPHDPLGAVISAGLELNPDLVAFGINKDRFFNGRELILFCRKFAHCFADPNQATKLIASLQNFEIKFEQVHKKEDDRKGNANEQIKSALKFTRGEVPLTWDLKMPLFKGTEDERFAVEIEIEAQNGHPAFAFYSMEVDLLLRHRGKELVLAEADKFRSQFVVLEVS